MRLKCVSTIFKYMFNMFSNRNRINWWMYFRRMLSLFSETVKHGLGPCRQELEFFGILSWGNESGLLSFFVHCQNFSQYWIGFHLPLSSFNDQLIESGNFFRRQHSANSQRFMPFDSYVPLQLLNINFWNFSWKSSRLFLHWLSSSPKVTHQLRYYWKLPPGNCASTWSNAKLGITSGPQLSRSQEKVSDWSIKLNY